MGLVTGGAGKVQAAGGCRPRVRSDAPRGRLGLCSAPGRHRLRHPGVRPRAGLGAAGRTCPPPAAAAAAAGAVRRGWGAAGGSRLHPSRGEDLGDPVLTGQAAPAGGSGRLCPLPPKGPAQKLVFNRVNGKRPQVLLQQVSAPEECYTLAHEENVRFVYEAWQQVEQQLDGSRSGESACGPVQYVEKTPNPELMKNFVPIDLEEWWAQQFLAKIENCT
ncbi:MAPK regulated corepressor interacting protein 2 isoform X2 [Falco rusticolus]|uniref:MAPK regulated corepressor interacting protein 2 isoform X2 n=1 Tax=Falco rusticolus TaxID=120794 RepID=UPI0018865D4A|nr:MAPK regulated corepressor interacting protein 2 isoform X2 [Falco rusticolus]